MLGNNSPWLSQISVCLASRGIIWFCFDYLCKDVCIVSIFGKQKWCLFRQKSGMCTVQYNVDNVSLWIRYFYCSFLIHEFPKYMIFFFYNAAHCVFKDHLALYISPRGNWGSGDRHKKMLTFWLVLLLRIIKISSLSQESHVFCQYMWNCGRLTCYVASMVESQVSGLPQFLIGKTTDDNVKVTHTHTRAIHICVYGCM